MWDLFRRLDPFGFIGINRDYVFGGFMFFSYFLRQKVLPGSQLLVTLQELQTLCHQTFLTQLKAQVIIMLHVYTVSYEREIF